METNLEEIPAVELLKTKVKVVNNLNDAISEVRVCYAESIKGRGLSYVYNYKSINIESKEFINWKNVVNFGEIQSLQDVDSTEYVYFGNNRGYWQVYFKYIGNDYKINKNNANFNLEKRDQEEPAVIEILHHNNGIFADFRAHSGHDYFWMKIGKPVERGILVSVRNELSAEVSEVRLVYAESTTTRHVNIETEENIQFKKEVSFDDQTAGSNQTITSTNRVVFSYHRSLWQLYFNYGGYFYKLKLDDANFDLKRKDNGKILNIIILSQTEPHHTVIPEISVKFNINSQNERTFLTQMKESVQTRQIKCLRLVSTLQCVSNFAHLLDIRGAIKKTLKTIPRGSYDDRTYGYSKLFFRSKDHQTDELITDKPSNLKFCPTHHNEETFRSVYNLKQLLEEDIRLGSSIREQLNEVEMLAPDQIGNTGNQFLYGFGIAAEMITLVGIDELSLIVRVGPSVECGLNLEEFEKAMDDESRLLNHGLKTDAITESPIDVRSLLVNAFLREFDKYELITRGAIKTMRAVASALHGNTRNVAITKTSGGIFGIAGGVILIIGLALEPVTLGASTPLVITGITLVASSGAVSIGAAIGDAVARSIIVTTMKQSLNEKVLLKTLSSLAEMIGTVHILNQGLDPDSATPTELARNVGRSVGDVARVGTATGLSAGLKVVGEGGLQALRNAFRFGAVAVGIVFDLVTVFDSGSTLATGAKSDLGYKWAYDSMKLEEDLANIKRQIDNNYIYVR